MTLSTGNQIITIHILPNILIEHNMRSTFLQNLTQNVVGKPVSEPLLKIEIERI